MAYTVKQMHDALSVQITSKEQLDKILIDGYQGNTKYIGKPAVRESGGRLVREEVFYYPVGSYIHPRTAPEDWRDPAFMWAWITGGANHLDHSRWWLMREWLRVRYGVYQMTEQLWRLAQNGAADYAAHCARSSDDKNLIAFTPDPEAGERDKQVRTTLSKFLRRIAPSAPDHTLRDIEASHRAELSDEIEFLTGDEIVNAYIGGPHSCMAYPSAQFNKEGIHPTKAYDAPGIALAVMRSTEGKIVARSITFVDPEDPEDKRYVRVYGDVALKRRLTRAGFVCSGLAGARLRRLELKNKDVDLTTFGVLAVPYLDPPGGGGSGLNANTPVGALLDGEWLWLIDEEQYETFRKRVPGKRVIPASSSSGVVTYQKSTAMTTEMIDAICCLSGAKITGAALMVYQSGRVLPAAKEAVRDHGLKPAYAYLDGGGLFETVYISTEVPTFKNGGYDKNLYVDDALSRENSGWRLLHDKYYPEGTWARHNEVTAIYEDDIEVGSDDDEDEFVEEVVEISADPEARFIRNVDAVHVIEKESRRAQLVHIRSIERKNYKVIHRYDNDFQTLVHKEHEGVTRTAGGRTCVVGVHKIVQMLDGQWEFRKLVNGLYIFGERVWAKKDVTQIEAFLSEAGLKVAEKALRDKLNERGNPQVAAERKRILVSELARYYAVPMLISQTVTLAVLTDYLDISASSFDNLVAATRKIRAENISPADVNAGRYVNRYELPVALAAVECAERVLLESEATGEPAENEGRYVIAA